MPLNPVAFTEQVVTDFLHYQLTTYPLADVDLYGQLKALLHIEQTRTTPLRKGPFISLSRPFKQGAAVTALVAQGIFHPKMPSVVSHPSLRQHQELAIRAIARGETTLVATGTGSGKTEAFLYPIISRCLELQDAGAPPGVVAVLIYPMNALAEDQLDRLRGLLAGRGIPFGMYVGKTPNQESQVSGERLPAGSSNSDYDKRLKQMREAGLATTLLPPEERASREAMRKPGGQPRILLTNVKQLELLLTRGKDVGIFADAPLEFLVFDEAHTFRGAQGAETAVLIRRLRTFCGRSADDVTCIATSATMADPNGGDQAAADFARRFFGVDGDKVTLVGEHYEDWAWPSDGFAPTAPSRDPADILTDLLEDVERNSGVGEAISDRLIELGGLPLPSGEWQPHLTDLLRHNLLVRRMAEFLEKAKPLDELAAHLTDKLGRGVTPHEVLCWLALGAACGRDEHDPFLRPVVHSFIRGVGGAVVTFSDDLGKARLWLAGGDAAAEHGDAWRRFPLFTCTTCGQHYYETWVKDYALPTGKGGPTGGDLVDTTRVWEHLAEELGGSRALLVDRLVVSQDEDDNAEDDDAGELPEGHDYTHRRLHPMWACAACGGLQEHNTHACGACGAQQSMVTVQAVRHSADYPGLLHSCVACQAPGRRPRGGRYREPARPVRAVSVSDVHVLAQSMVHLSERPRLLVFADNRQDAAFQSGWMRDHARRFRLRALMAQQIPDEGASVGDVAQALDALLDADRELSRSLIPEVWQVVHQEDAGTKHREERLYFLRLQVLREVATGVKQRIGLEPWGRLQVDYIGLTPSLPFVQTWAPRLDIEPEALVEGIAALLDHQRRVRVLHDGQTRLFGIRWNSGDKEVQYGYIPAFPGGPRGVKLSRAPSDLPARVTQWVGSRPTQVWNAVASWGVSETELEAFLGELFAALKKLGLLVPVEFTGWGKPLKGVSNPYQVDASKLRLHSHVGRWRCSKCRRTTVRRGPTSLCLAWRCGGLLTWEVEDTEDFDLRVLDGNYRMLRVAEHSAQVPHNIRERIENQFKGDLEQINTLVCTPTLELGVDIGALDAVLMRNVPPSAANYWQRAGRAGRRHRMAVDITYAQATGFDQAYFRDPLKLLGGLVEPPRFNLKNEVMIRKHVHATVLTTLLGVARGASDDDRAHIEGVLGRCFPPTLRTFLFTPGGEVLPQVLDIAELGTLIAQHRSQITAAVQASFTHAWPAEDSAAVAPAVLGRVVDEVVLSLQVVLKRFKRRLDWARGELARLATEEAKKGVLDPEDQAHRRRCQRVISRLKGTAQRRRGDAQGGVMDSESMGALAREGFLPGYGLESGSIIGTCEPPRMTEGLSDFDLPRAPSLALREYVPGNAIYANGFRFVPRRFQLTPDDTLRFRILVDQQVVDEVGADSPTAPLAEHEVRAVPVCDAILPSQSQISDEEEFRFQMPVATYGNDRGYHRGGTAWRWSDLDVRFRRGVQVRLVNVGPRSEVEQNRVGYPLCLACGQSLSPYASKKAREEFEASHLDRCGHVVQPTGFYADVEVDVLGLHEVVDRRTAFSVAEALRMGAARVLDMEIEDLQILTLGRAGEESVDIFLYDPMPGGSGLLEHLAQRWDAVRLAAVELAQQCPSACEASCIDCLQTYRNRFYHEHLDRHRAIEVLGAHAGPLVELHPIPEHLQTTSTTTGQPQTFIENKFKALLAAAGLPAPVCQKPIDLGAGFGRTIPDFFYEVDDEDEPGVCIYLDGMSGHIHGNDAQQAKDKAIRARLRELEYLVVAVTSTDLDDEAAVVRAISRIARHIVGKAKQQALKDDTSWVGAAAAPASAASRPSRRPALRLIRCSEEAPGAIPVMDLKIAAGAFSEGQVPLADDYVQVEGGPKKPGLFVAQVVGDSMDKVAPRGAWCLWQNLGAGGVSGPAPTEDLVVRRPDGPDPEMGAFTFKRLIETPEGRKLTPVSSNTDHKPIPLAPDAEVEGVARFVAVVEW
jgi:DEAD/DEAH box helicase/Helicase conserved C-terminal domain/Domain of unknown function (DUF1998)/Peptidase S24-like